jgi:glucokinase
MSVWIGLDFGGTNLRAALVEPGSGLLSTPARMETPALEGPHAVMDAMARLIQTVIAQANLQSREIAGIGIGCPASVDLARGVLMVVPNVPGDWPAIAFKDLMTQKTGIPVFPINDVRAITLGEFTFGAGRGVDTLACYAVGTGIGGGVVVNGRLHLGISGSAGELGHQIVDPFGALCNCGSRGCLETISSGPAIAAAAAHAIIMRRPTQIADLVAGDLNRITPAVVIQAARAGDPLAVSIIDRAGMYIGFAIVNTLVTISPRRILIGGGVAAAGDLLLDPIRHTVRERTRMVPVDQVEILPTALGDKAGLIGAALWAQLHSIPSA